MTPKRRVKNMVHQAVDESVAARIRKRHAEGIGIIKIAKNFSVSQATVLRIIKGELFNERGPHEKNND